MNEPKVTEPKVILKYIGGGSVIYHVPPRDLTEADFAERKELWEENAITETILLMSGLYEKVNNEPAPKKVKAGKDGE